MIENIQYPVTPYTFNIMTLAGEIGLRIEPTEFDCPAKFQINNYGLKMPEKVLKEYFREFGFGMRGYKFDLEESDQTFPEDIYHVLTLSKIYLEDGKQNSIRDFEVLGFIPPEGYVDLFSDPDVLMEKRKAPILPRLEARGLEPFDREHDALYKESIDPLSNSIKPIFERVQPVTDYNQAVKAAHSFDDIENVFAAMFGPIVVKKFISREISELESKIKSMREKSAELDDENETGITKGEKATSYLNDNTPIDLQYAVVEIDRLITSHDDDMSLNEGFSQDLQPRDRTREGMKLQVEQMAGKLNPERLGESTSVSTGAPVIGQDLTVESGNGRTIAIRKAYNSGTKGQEYKQWIIDNSGNFGISGKIIEGMDKPVLVRIRITEIDRAEFTRKANEDEIAQMAPSELARADAAKLTDKDLALFQPSEDGDITATSNRAFLARFVENMGGVAATGYMTKDGGYTKQLIDRVQAAIFQKAYQDDNLLALMAEEMDPKIKNILSAMTVAAGEFSQAKALSSDLMGINIPGCIIEAAKLVKRSKGDGESLEMVLNQGGFFDNVSEDTKHIARFINDSIRSAKRMGAVFKEAGRLLKTRLEYEKAPKLIDAGEPLPTPTQIVTLAIEKEKTAREGTRLFESAGGVLMTLTGKELGDDIDSENSVKTARAYYRAKLQGKTVTREGVGEIRFSGKGWEKFRRGIKTDIKKAKLLPVAPVIIQYGKHCVSDPFKTRHDNIKRFHFFDGKVEMENEIILVGVTVGEDDRGHLFYNLNHDPDVLYEKRKAPSLSGVEARRSGPLESSVPENLAPASEPSYREHYTHYKESIGADMNAVKEILESSAIDKEAHKAASSPKNNLSEPTEAQKEAGNYRKGHVTISGLAIAIENPKGSERSGIDPNGKKWSVTMPAHYGYVKKTKAPDGDNFDVYIGENTDSERVFIVDQLDVDTGKFDECKGIIGCNDSEDAREVYCKGFSDGKGVYRIGAITELSMEAFKKWLREGDIMKSASNTILESAQNEDIDAATEVAKGILESANTFAWQDFYKNVLKINKYRDTFGKVSDAEKKHWSAAGDYWQLEIIDPKTLNPVNDPDADHSKPILIGPDGDIIDGRNRRATAIENKDKSIVAWRAYLGKMTEGLKPRDHVQDGGKNLFEDTGEFDWRRAVSVSVSFDEIFSVFEKIFPMVINNSKKSWEMTIAEFWKRNPEIVSEAQAYAVHFTDIQDAIKAGKDIPAEVINEYQDILSDKKRNDKDIPSLINVLVAEERAQGQAYPRAEAYRNYLKALNEASTRKQIMEITSEADSYLTQGDRYLREENPTADKIRSFLNNLIIEKRRSVTPSYDTARLDAFIDDYHQKYKSILAMEESKGKTYGKNIKKILGYLQEISGIMKDSAHIGLYEQSDFSTLREEINRSIIPNIRRTLKQDPLNMLSDQRNMDKLLKLIKTSLQEGRA